MRISVIQSQDGYLVSPLISLAIEIWCSMSAAAYVSTWATIPAISRIEIQSRDYPLLLPIWWVFITYNYVKIVLKEEIPISLSRFILVRITAPSIHAGLEIPPTHVVMNNWKIIFSLRGCIFLMRGCIWSVWYHWQSQ